MRHLPDVLAVIGAALGIFGIGMMHVPSAVILTGVIIVFVAYSLNKAQK